MFVRVFVCFGKYQTQTKLLVRVSAFVPKSNFFCCFPRRTSCLSDAVSLPSVPSLLHIHIDYVCVSTRSRDMACVSFLHCRGLYDASSCLTCNNSNGGYSISDDEMVLCVCVSEYGRLSSRYVNIRYILLYLFTYPAIPLDSILFANSTSFE